MPYRTLLILAAALLVIAVGGGVLYQSTTLPKVTSSVASLSVREAADGLNGFSLLDEAPLVPSVIMKDEAGVESTLEAYRGKVVLLNLWATWCPPCIREMPDLNALQKDFALIKKDG